MKSYKVNQKSIKAKCTSCGAVLNENINTPGYTPVLNKASLCQRCFQLKHYGKTTADYNIHKNFAQKTLADIDYSKHAIFYVCDLTTVCFSIEDIKQIKEQAKIFYLIISKIDLIITTKNFEIIKKRIFDFLDKCNLGIENNKIIICSVSNKINFHELNETVKKLVKNKNKVCFVGYTNAGKSSLINWIIQKNEINHSPLIVSHNLNSTQGIKQIKNKEFSLIDLPGKADDSNFQAIMSPQQLKINLSMSKSRPRNYQLQKDKQFLFENLFLLQIKKPANDAKIVFYFRPNLQIHQSNILDLDTLKIKFKNIFPKIDVPNFEEWKNYNFRSLKNSCLVLNGLGIINFYNIQNINLMLPKSIKQPFFINNFKL